ncbi:HAD domain-containing protein [Comamonas thiooxydans]|uniref:HAD domain-containing protein n=1 Tax=Comamonas thiooxydans TaxID=363952 RepID=UPI000B416723|nr:HAD domain-containing protein [Comamonas thiooxydans]
MKRAATILYLDFDGVLHPDRVYRTLAGRVVLRYPELRAPGHAFFEGEPLLVEMLARFPSVAIVLSTSWVRKIKNYREIVQLLSPALQARVIGSTFHSRITDRFSYDNMSRGQQIQEDVLHRRPSRWIALDDDDDLWPAQSRDKLVTVDSELGLLFDPEAQLSLERALILVTNPHQIGDSQ